MLFVLSFFDVSASSKHRFHPTFYNETNAGYFNPGYFFAIHRVFKGFS